MLVSFVRQCARCFAGRLQISRPVLPTSRADPKTCLPAQGEVGVRIAVWIVGSGRPCWRQNYASLGGVEALLLNKLGLGCGIAWGMFVGILQHTL